MPSASAISFSKLSGSNFFSLVHQHRFERKDVNLGDLVEHGFAAIDLAGEGPTALGDASFVRGLFDVAAGKGLDVLPGWILGLLRAGAGEDDLLGQRQVFVFPPGLIVGPNLLGVDGRPALRGGSARTCFSV
jgi:hypothetical protein